MSGWSLRRLGPSDWRLMRAVRLAMLLDEPSAYGSTFARESAFTEETWRERLQQPVFLVERDDGLPLATATLLRLDPRDEPEIVAMWVAGHARGQGLADAVVHACQEQAVADGADTVALHVMVDNPRAAAAYARLGFIADDAPVGADGCARMHWRPTGERETNE